MSRMAAWGSLSSGEPRRRSSTRTGRPSRQAAPISLANRSTRRLTSVGFAPAWQETGVRALGGLPGAGGMAESVMVLPPGSPSLRRPGQLVAQGHPAGQVVQDAADTALVQTRPGGDLGQRKPVAPELHDGAVGRGTTLQDSAPQL